MTKQYIAPERHTQPCGNGWIGKDKHFISRPITIKLKGNIKTKGNITDTVYGCSGNCPMECYAKRNCGKLGVSPEGWGVPVSQVLDEHILTKTLLKTEPGWVRIGVMGDPCFNWPLLVKTCKIINGLQRPKIPVPMTRMWVLPTYEQLAELKDCNAHLHVSITPFDPEKYLSSMFEQHHLYTEMGGRWIWRVVTFNFDKTIPRGQELWNIQDTLMAMPNTMEQPAKIFTTNPRYHLMNKSAYKRYHDTSNITAGRLYPDHHACFTRYCYQCDHQCMTFPKSYNWIQTQIDTFKDTNKTISQDCQRLIEILTENKNNV